MARTVSVTGTVKNKFGMVIPNAEVKILNQFDGTQAKTFSEKDGKFAIPMTSFGNAYITVGAKGYSGYSNMDLGVSNESLSLGDIVLEDETVIRGKITTEDGNPIKDDSLILYLYPGDTKVVGEGIQTKGGSRQQYQELTLDSSSRYEWRGAEAGEYVLTLSNRNYETTISERFTVKAGETVDNINLVLKDKSKVQLSGTFVYEDGSRIGRSTSLTLRWNDKEHNAFVDTNDGTFKISGLKKHIPYKLEYGVDYSDRKTTEVVLTEDDSFIKLTIPNKTEKDYILAVWDKETSKPITGIEVESPHSAVRGEGLRENEVLCGLENKTNRITMKGHEYPWQVVSVSPKKIGDGEKIHILLSKGYNFKGRIIDEQTQGAVSNVSVSFSGVMDSKTYLGTVTDSQGRFDVVIPPVENQILYMKITPPEPYGARLLRSPMGIDNSPSDWGDIEIGKASNVTLKIVDFNNKPLSGVRLRYGKSMSDTNVIDSYNVGQNQTTNLEGFATFEAASGKMSLAIDGLNYLMRKTFNIRSGSDSQTVRLGTVEGRISSNKISDEVNKISIWMTHTDGTAMSFELKKESGEIIPLQPGEWSVNISTYQILANGERKPKGQFKETINVPDVLVFEKKFVVP